MRGDAFQLICVNEDMDDYEHTFPSRSTARLIGHWFVANAPIPGIDCFIWRTGEDYDDDLPLEVMSSYEAVAR